MTLAQHLTTLFARQLEKLESGRHAICEPVDLARRLEDVKRRFGGGYSDLVQKDRIEAAILKLKTSGAKELTSRERYVLAYGLTQASPALKGRAVIEDDALVASALACWETDAQGGRLKGAVWRGLFRSYLQAGPGRGAQSLRQLLSKSWKDVIGSRRVPPAWLQAIERHGCLLSDTPCSPYIDEFLDGQRGGHFGSTQKPAQVGIEAGRALHHGGVAAVVEEAQLGVGQ